MMVGLFVVGKIIWVIKYVVFNFFKKYNILGINVIMDKMWVMGLCWQWNYVGCWDVLIQQVIQCFNCFIQIVVCKKCNYILDQINVYGLVQR